MIASTINYRLNCLDSVFVFHKIPDAQNPLTDLRPLLDPGRKGRERIIKDEEFKKIIGATTDIELSDYDVVLRYTGARAGITAARLEWDPDICFEEEKIKVPKEKNKGKKDQKHAYEIEMDGRVFPTLLRRREMCRNLTLQQARQMYPFLASHTDSEIIPVLNEARRYVFPSYILRLRLAGHRTLYQYASDTFRTLARGLEIPDVYLHDLRRTAGSEYYIRSGCDIVATRDFLGHLNITTTQRYLHIKTLSHGSNGGVQPVANNPYKKPSGTLPAPEPDGAASQAA